MKHVSYGNSKIGRMSLPVRERGLKHRKVRLHRQGKDVAPRAGAWIETIYRWSGTIYVKVAPRAGAWIETEVVRIMREYITVAPRAGAWIETTDQMKGGLLEVVAPRAGAWIETTARRHCADCKSVAPRAGAWIETASMLTNDKSMVSLPVRERGLKPAMSA